MTDITEMADEGANRAAAHADRIIDQWTKTAAAFLLMYARHNREFMAESVRMAAEKYGIAPPPDKRAWGCVLRRCKLAGQIESCGVAKQASRNCHGSYKTVWRLKK